MENHEDVDKLFFELASESRIDILRELNAKSWKMNALARKLDLTTTETFRQLQRLGKTTFVSKDVNGFYGLTPFGKLVLFLSPSFDFILKYRQYFLDHDVWGLPSEFIFRIGELSNGVLEANFFDGVKMIEEIIASAEDYIWTMTSQVLAPHGRVVEERLRGGVKFRSLHPEGMLPVELDYSEFGDCIERRYLPKTPVIIVITGKKACVSFPFFGDNLDYMAFFAEDPNFMKWTTDLYLHYWQHGEVLRKNTKTSRK